MLEGPGEALGLIALDASALAAILEQQTTGTVAATAPPPRRPTRIDAAMCAPLINLLLEEFDLGLHDCARAGRTDLPPRDFRYASFIEDPRPLGLVLEDGRYRTFRVALGLGTTARPGRMLMALPAATATAPTDDRARATAMVFDLARRERDAWLNWPPRVAALMAAELGVEAHQMETVLERHVRAHLGELAEVKVELR